MLFSKRKKKDKLDAVIEQLLAEMEPGWDTDEYSRKANDLKVLMEVKAATKPRTISPDTIAIVGANLAGIILILIFERQYAIASKSLPFVMKPQR